MKFPSYDDAKVYYGWGFDIKFCVEYDVITATQYKEITGEDYDTNESTPSKGASGETDGTVGTDKVNLESDTTETTPVSE